MPNSFTNIFGGSTIYPSEIGYIQFSISQNTTLVWPDLGGTSRSVAAAFIRATATTTGLNFVLPNADYASVGKVLRFKNIGSNAFNVNTQAGGTILTASAGQDWLLSITDNTTSGGTWDASQVGSGTTSANAAALAGNGLAVSGSTLVTSWPIVPFSSTPYSIPLSGRYNLYEWYGGAGIVEFPTPGPADNGFTIFLKNLGTGVLTISNLVDYGLLGSPLTLVPPNGAVFDWDGADWHSFGYVNITSLNLNSTYTKTLTATSVSLTTTEAQNNIITFAGTLSGNTTVNFPNSVFIYDITNSTSGAYSLTVRPSSASGVTINQGATRLVTNNSSTMYFSDDGPTISTGTGLTGGPVTSSGTIQFASIAPSSLWSNVSTATAQPVITTLGAGLAFSGTTLVNTSGAADGVTSILFQSGLSGGTITSTGTVGVSNGGISSIMIASDIALSGNPTAVTQSAGNSTTRIATTAFVNGTALTLASGTTALTQTTNDSGTRVATTAFVNPANSIATNAGYVKLASGLILQWGAGSTTINPGGGTVVVTYSLSFPNATVFVSVTPTSFSVNDQCVIPKVAPTNANFTVTNNDPDSGINGWFWFALGF